MKKYPGITKFLIAVISMLLIITFAMWFAQVKPIVLWTDRLVFILVITIAGFFTYVRSKEHLLTPWRHVVRRPLAVVSLVVLSVYVFIGLLDSVHFRQALEQSRDNNEIHYSVEVESLLDVIVNPIRKNIEKSSC